MTWEKKPTETLGPAGRWERVRSEQRERALSKTWAPSSKGFRVGRTKKSRCLRHRQPHIASENYHPTGTFLITPLRDSTSRHTPSTFPSIYRPIPFDDLHIFAHSCTNVLVSIIVMYPNIKKSNTNLYVIVVFNSYAVYKQTCFIKFHPSWPPEVDWIPKKNLRIQCV